MKLLIKQRVFSWTDTYDIYDEFGEKKYLVKAEMFSFTHRIHIYDRMGGEIGTINQRFFSLMPAFDIEIGGVSCGSIEKQLSLFSPKYNIDYNGWSCKGDFMAWNYNVYSENRAVVHISKEIFSWGDTYVIDIEDPRDEIFALMLAIAIDAANCSNDRH